MLRGVERDHLSPPASPADRPLQLATCGVWIIFRKRNKQITREEPKKSKFNRDHPMRHGLTSPHSFLVPLFFNSLSFLVFKPARTDVSRDEGGVRGCHEILSDRSSSQSFRASSHWSPRNYTPAHHKAYSNYYANSCVKPRATFNKRLTLNDRNCLYFNRNYEVFTCD